MSDLSPARYVGGVLYVCDRCGAETINTPCQCGQFRAHALRATVTRSFGSESTTYTVPSPLCLRCGKPRMQVGSGEGLCTCPVEIPGMRIVGLHPGNAKIGPDFDEPLRAAWECPRCHTINAPHVDRCSCKESQS